MKKLVFLEGLSKVDELAVFALETVNTRKLLIVRMDNNMLVHQKVLQQMKFDYLWMLTKADISICEEEMFRELERIENTEVCLIEPSSRPY
jgi:hypothetical protein